MIPFTIRIETVSATAPGSGEGRASVIDRDITYDAQGLPLLGGRRLKGLLREAASEVHETLATFGGWRAVNLLPPEDLFGLPGKKQPGPFRVEDARLENHAALSEWIAYARSLGEGRHYFHQEAVQAAYTEVRSQTAMNAATGGPQENTLRVTRLLRPHTVLFATGELEGGETGWQQKALRTLWLACRCLRRAGLSRNRGPGLIDVTLTCATMPAVGDADWLAEELKSEQEPKQ